MVLGNGRVGKTQLCRNLAGEKFEPESQSTHGVTVETVELSRGKGKTPIPLHIWDFGGQDIYHGTHALFLRDHAIFALVWGSAFETRDPAAPGVLFGHRPLRYWVDYISHLGGKNQAVVIVRCLRLAIGRLWSRSRSASIAAFTRPQAPGILGAPSRSSANSAASTSASRKVASPRRVAALKCTRRTRANAPRSSASATGQAASSAGRSQRVCTTTTA